MYVCVYVCARMYTYISMNVMYAAVMQYRLHSAGSRPEPLLQKKILFCIRIKCVYSNLYRLNPCVSSGFVCGNEFLAVGTSYPSKKTMIYQTVWNQLVDCLFQSISAIPI